MIEFVNAKINIGLNIVGRREDGYHLLETLFYPVGIHNGTPVNPEPFCDVMELNPRSSADPEGYEECGVRFLFSGNVVDCLPEKNLVVKGIHVLAAHYGEDRMKSLHPLTLRLQKHLPDGAGMGGGSADAVAAMKLLRRYAEAAGLPKVSDDQLRELALKVGADCPMFVANMPAYGEGIGEKLAEVDSFLKGMWLVVVKPSLHISTAEAFAGVTPRRPVRQLRELIQEPLYKWRDHITNDFEDSLFPRHPELAELKSRLYEEGADYASLTGSGAALYGIFTEEHRARRALQSIDVDYKTLILL
ncbi:MAG: 4-(cytidine 5'-diphospho)-2-C-methyl-D-erythritol kinase [Muribaculaceae bacterium]|nr:4-(cytidine 5'-diphospho)-2-C-methyl-D-erythritol kinase [Muribaculaceae bacterium]